MERPVLVDLRNVYRPEDAARHGFQHIGIGCRKLPSPAFVPEVACDRNEAVIEARALA
jgi:UDPglucose 6-dehydrogenase